MADIVDFLEARLDEDEAESLDSLQHEPYPESWANILAARVLLECAVKRKILAHFMRCDEESAPLGAPEDVQPFLFIIAEPYMDHPDYQPEWRLQELGR